ncbi:hypothetical protein [Chitiniphilus eburneus]|uniref:Uncharacterized protein n=1 Tax=Chitiniphilus eburneus TaxID=2571148 RepID=A0A4U0P8W5_9NEIS|nr:hypothetical protein [Chitiniphilus eburneus]TJZ63859.1 hypothetical protein FAZ21_19615 [Chitiniphilus eburneus]
MKKFYLNSMVFVLISLVHFCWLLRLPPVRCDGLVVAILTALLSWFFAFFLFGVMPRKRICILFGFLICMLFGAVVAGGVVLAFEYVRFPLPFMNSLRLGGLSWVLFTLFCCAGWVVGFLFFLWVVLANYYFAGIFKVK